MIQRIQTVYLAIASLLGIGGLFVPAWQFVSGGETERLDALHIYRTDPSSNISESFTAHPAHLVWMVASVLVSAYLIFVIFQYQNRVRQILLCQIGILGLMATLAAQLYTFMNGPYIIHGSANTGKPFVGFAFSIVSLILVWMASKRIKKDDDLVKSVDRLR